MCVCVCVAEYLKLAIYNGTLSRQSSKSQEAIFHGNASRIPELTHPYALMLARTDKDAELYINTYTHTCA